MVYYLSMRVTKLLIISFASLFFVFLSTSKALAEKTVTIIACPTGLDNTNLSLYSAEINYGDGSKRTIVDMDQNIADCPEGFGYEKEIKLPDKVYGNDTYSYAIKISQNGQEISTSSNAMGSFKANDIEDGKVLTIKFTVGTVDKPATGKITSEPPTEGTPSDEDVCTMFGCFGKETALKDYTNAVFTWALWAAAVAALSILVYAGFMYMTSGGNPDSITNAKGWIFSALSSVALLALAKLIFSIFGIKWFG
ncbi:MAG: hypothetical protein UT66_C0015G0010 [candidate division CPR2 bacterium GW2011_GWC1_39_9]|uniref:Uncharacterized protein n=1 Tax=candidate division CPR2 bacterium GW2011_GWC2_39_10 TaxID=1618345 RepID=A0A0G0M3R5_UNCC2|nr:MAG: hypothetical protein UT18_C0005G0010 [candidate division CPR2 bacterium GW2011_GWC2_39_10]KKR34846.1 MAG: hypothetical protein UT66_C0015G0010 [candidate division CPR2 bacterium GW2011_GWC1_39_9]